MQDVYHFFVMVIKNVLEYVHKIIMTQKKKRKPHPSRLRGRGVEVSKTLFRKKGGNGMECREKGKGRGGGGEGGGAEKRGGGEERRAKKRRGGGALVIKKKRGGEEGEGTGPSTKTKERKRGGNPKKGRGGRLLSGYPHSGGCGQRGAQQLQQGPSWKSSADLRGQ